MSEKSHNYVITNNTESSWSCKCTYKCNSKKAHKAKWALLSIYKKSKNTGDKKNKILLDKSAKITKLKKSPNYIPKPNILVPVIKFDNLLNKTTIDYVNANNNKNTINIPHTISANESVNINQSANDELEWDLVDLRTFATNNN
jgi:hypothetical protein